MKLSIKYLILGLAVAILASCSDDDGHVYDGNADHNQTLVRFGKTTYKFEVPRDSSTILDVQVLASTKSDSDRTFNVEVVDSVTTANPDTYTLPETVTIPAGEYIGHLAVEGVDNNLVETSPSEIVTLKLSDPNPSSNRVLESNITELKQYEVCPPPEDFLVGKFMLTNVDEHLGPGNDTHNFGEGEVTLSIGETSSERVFTATALPGFGSPQSFSFSLICGEIVFEENPIPVQCDQGIVYGPAGEGNNATYDTNTYDDSEVTIYYQSDYTNDCNGGGTVDSFKLTKVN